ncbi:MAG: ATP synthase F1 subunit gamma [bacterium]
MSTTLKEIKNRIKAATNIRQITKAMKLISSIKLKKIQKAFLPFKNYQKSIEELISVLVKNIDFKLIVSNVEFFKVRKSNKDLVVIFSSDKGLCGAFNTNLFMFFEKSFKRDNVKLITVGKKAILYFSRRNYEIVDHFEKIPDIPSFEFSRKLNELVKKIYISDSNISSVKLVYNSFISSIKYEPRIETLLPISEQNFKATNYNVNHFIFEPSLEKIASYLFELYIDSLIYKVLMDSKLSEFSARFTAMNTATENAENLIKELKLLFFKRRQESITKELLEISAGVEALKQI